MIKRLAVIMLCFSSVSAPEAQVTKISQKQLITDKLVRLQSQCEKANGSMSKLESVCCSISGVGMGLAGLAVLSECGFILKKFENSLKDNPYSCLFIFLTIGSTIALSLKSSWDEHSFKKNITNALAKIIARVSEISTADECLQAQQLLEEAKWQMLAGWNLSNQMKSRKEFIEQEFDKAIVIFENKKKALLVSVAH